MLGDAGYFTIACAFVMAVTAIFIVLNWLSFIAFLIKKPEGNFSFAPPFICGVLGAIATFVAIENHAFWFATAFLLLDPSIGLSLGFLALKQLRK